MYNILAVSGSPRKDGNTEILVNAAVEPLLKDGHRVHRFFLSGKKVAPCVACEGCEEDGICVIKDDMQELLEQFEQCDAMIVGSPVYTRNITAQLLALFNRYHCISHKNPSKGRIIFGGGIAVGGSPNSQGITLATIYNFLLSRGVCCVPAVLNGVTVVARQKGEVLSQPKSLQDCGVLGVNILRMLRESKRS